MSLPKGLDIKRGFAFVRGNEVTKCIAIKRGRTLYNLKIGDKYYGERIGCAPKLMTINKIKRFIDNVLCNGSTLIYRREVKWTRKNVASAGKLNP